MSLDYFCGGFLDAHDDGLGGGPAAKEVAGVFDEVEQQTRQLGRLCLGLVEDLVSGGYLDELFEAEVVESVDLELGVVLGVLLEQPAERRRVARELVDDFFEDADCVFVRDVRLEVYQEPCDDFFQQRLLEVLE